MLKTKLEQFNIYFGAVHIDELNATFSNNNIQVMLNELNILFSSNIIHVFIWLNFI